MLDVDDMFHIIDQRSAHMRGHCRLVLWAMEEVTKAGGSVPGPDHQSGSVPHASGFVPGHASGSVPLNPPQIFPSSECVLFWHNLKDSQFPPNLINVPDMPYSGSSSAVAKGGFQHVRLLTYQMQLQFPEGIEKVVKHIFVLFEGNLLGSETLFYKPSSLLNGLMANPIRVHRVEAIIDSICLRTRGSWEVVCLACSESLHKGLSFGASFKSNNMCKSILIVTYVQVDAGMYLAKSEFDRHVKANPKNVARCADFIRFSYIYVHGGCICDCDTLWLRSWSLCVGPLMYFGHYWTVQESNRSTQGTTTCDFLRKAECQFFNTPGENLALTFPAFFPPRSPIVKDFLVWARPQIIGGDLDQDMLDFMKKQVDLIRHWGLCPAVGADPLVANGFPTWRQDACLRREHASSGKFDMKLILGGIGCNRSLVRYLKRKHSKRGPWPFLGSGPGPWIY